jgi:hypothetical protein
MLRDIGFRLDHYINGIWLARSFHPGRHAAYTRALYNILSAIPRPATQAARVTAAEKVGIVLEAARRVLRGRNLPLRFADARRTNANLTPDAFTAQWEAAIRAAMSKVSKR